MFMADQRGARLPSDAAVDASGGRPGQQPPARARGRPHPISGRSIFMARQGFGSACVLGPGGLFEWPMGGSDDSRLWEVWGYLEKVRTVDQRNIGMDFRNSARLTAATLVAIAAMGVSMPSAYAHAADDPSASESQFAESDPWKRGSDYQSLAKDGRVDTRLELPVRLPAREIPDPFIPNHTIVDFTARTTAEFGKLSMHMTAPSTLVADSKTPPPSFTVNARPNQSSPWDVSAMDTQTSFRDVVNVMGREINGYRAWTDVQFKIAASKSCTDSASITESVSITVGEASIGVSGSASLSTTSGIANSGTTPIYTTVKYRVEMFVADTQPDGSRPVYYKVFSP